MLVRSGLLVWAFAIATLAEAESGPRAPAGKWNVNFADAQCIATRDYGTPANPLNVALKAPAVGNVMQLAVIQPAPWTEAVQVSAFVAIDARPPLKTSLMMYSPKGRKERVYLLNLPSSEFESVRHASRLSIRSAGLNESFALSQMEPLLKVLGECVADLRRVFNVGSSDSDPAIPTRRAKANLASLFSDNDYPAVAIRKGLGGKVKFALLIGEDGRVADCTIVETSAVPALDSQACALLKTRAKFEVARDAAGKPVKDSYVASIVWRMP